MIFTESALSADTVAMYASCVSVCVCHHGSVRTNLLCIMGKLAGGESVALAVGVSDW